MLGIKTQTRHSNQSDTTAEYFSTKVGVFSEPHSIGLILSSWKHYLHFSDSLLRSLSERISNNKRRGTSPEYPPVEWVGSLSSTCVHGSANKQCVGKTTTLVGRKVVLYSQPFERLPFGSSAPSAFISEERLIGWQLVEDSYVVMGGSLGWKESWETLDEGRWMRLKSRFRRKNIGPAYVGGILQRPLYARWTYSNHTVHPELTW